MLDVMIFCGIGGPYIFEVVRLLGVEIGWSCHRHGGRFAEMASMVCIAAERVRIRNKCIERAKRS